MKKQLIIRKRFQKRLRMVMAMLLIATLGVAILPAEQFSLFSYRAQVNILPYEAGDSVIREIESRRAADATQKMKNHHGLTDVVASIFMGDEHRADDDINFDIILDRLSVWSRLQFFDSASILSGDEKQQELLFQQRRPRALSRAGFRDKLVYWMGSILGDNIMGSILSGKKTEDEKFQEYVKKELGMDMDSRRRMDEQGVEKIVGDHEAWVATVRKDPESENNEAAGVTNDDKKSTGTVLKNDLTGVVSWVIPDAGDNNGQSPVASGDNDADKESPTPDRSNSLSEGKSVRNDKVETLLGDFLEAGKNIVVSDIPQHQPLLLRDTGNGNGNSSVIEKNVLREVTLQTNNLVNVQESHDESRGLETNILASTADGRSGIGIGYGYGYGYTHSVPDQVFERKPITRSSLPEGFNSADDSIHLVPVSNKKRRGKQYLTFDQYYKKIPVYNGEVRMTLDSNGNLIAMKSDIHDAVSVDSAGLLSVPQAIVRLTDSMKWDSEKDIMNDVRLVVYPRMIELRDAERLVELSNVKFDMEYGVDRSSFYDARFSQAIDSSSDFYTYSLAYELRFTTQSPFGRWMVIMDAHTGEILTTESDLHMAAQWVEVRGYGKDEYGNVLSLPYPNLRLQVGVSSLFTDDSGRLFMNQPDWFTPSFENDRLLVVNDSPLAHDPETLQFQDTVPFDGLAYLSTLSESSMDAAAFEASPQNSLSFYAIPESYHKGQQYSFYHLNRIMNVLQKEYAHEFEHFLQIHVESLMSEELFNGCSSFYDSVLNTIHFAMAGCGYESQSLSLDIILHEFVHFMINDISFIPSLQGTEAGAIHEGVADYFALSWQGDRSVFSPNPSGNTRNLQNDLTMSDWSGELHRDSLIFSGALWDLRSELGAELMDDLMYGALYAGHKKFTDVMYQLLVEDDDDENIFNGTPHAEEILTTFEKREIGPGYASFMKPYWQSSTASVAENDTAIIHETDSITTEETMNLDALFADESDVLNDGGDRYLFVYEEFPFIEASFSPTDIHLGNLSETVSTSSAVTVTVNTNAGDGWVLQGWSIGNGGTAGLVNDDGNGIIIPYLASSSVLSSGTEGVGLYGENPGIGVTVAEGFNNDSTSDVALTTNRQTIASTIDLQSGNRTVDIRWKAVGSATSVAGAYSDAVEFVVFARWE